MSESNAEVVSLLKSLSERFDTLQKDVETLKEKEARRSASRSPTPEAESSSGPESSDRSETSDDAETSTTRRRRKNRKTRSQEISKRRSTSRYRSRSRSRSPRYRLASRAKSPVPSKGKQRRTTRTWADRMSDSESEGMDYSERIVFSDSEAEDQPNTRLVEVSEKTKKFLHEKCTRRVPNSDRKVLRDRYPLPKVPATRTPQLDTIMKPEASPATKATDKQLSKVQTLLLDSLAPLTSLLENHHRGETLDHKRVIQAVRTAIELIGNANANMSHLRRERVVSDLRRFQF